MDKALHNVLEGARQYFMGVPKQAAQGEGAGSGAGAGVGGKGQPVWPAGAPPPEEGAPAQSGAPTPRSRPPSSAAAEPPPPPRPLSEPLEPEPHIIHKATVMREALEKRREQPDPEDDEDATVALSPPSHIIRRPPPALPSPAPAPAAPSPSPARPPSAPAVRPPEHYRPESSRLPDPYSATRPPEQYPRYHFDTPVPDGGRASRGPPAASPQPSVLPRHSPQQTYARISSTMPAHTAMRIRESSTHSPPARYATAPAPPPPHNDRVPPIHHHSAAPSESRVSQHYVPLHQRHETPAYSRGPVHYDRHAATAPRKYDHQQGYPGYRNAPGPPQPMQNHRAEHHHVQYKQHAPAESLGAHYAMRPQERVAGPAPPRETARIPPRAEYPSTNRIPVESRSGYQYPSTSTSTARYPPSATIPVVQNSTLPSRSAYRPTPVPKTPYDYASTSDIQTSPARPTAVKPGFASQQARMTVSVTTLVNQMNQTKQKRESPLDLSVKTVKHSADSSTTQDDHVDSATAEIKPLPLQPRPPLNTRHIPVAPAHLTASHKVDFAPDFHSQYRDRIASINFNSAVAASAQPPPAPARYNGTYERPSESYPAESWHPAYIDHNKHISLPKNDFVPRIDLTRAERPDERRSENRARDDRHFIIEERKRPSGPIISNIPEKIVRYETWSADSRIERSSRIDRSAREQQELMSRPVYSYSSHKRFEAYQNEQKKQIAPSAYRDTHTHVNHRYPYPVETPVRVPAEYHMHYDRNHLSHGRHVIQKLPNHRDLKNHHHDHHHSLDHHNGVPADKRVLSILRNSLEIKQSGFVEPPRQAKEIPDLIVIDDGDDAVIEITDLTSERDLDKNQNTMQRASSPSYGPSIHIPKAVDSIAREVDYERTDNLDAKSKSPESDVASRTRTKAELKAMPLPADNTILLENKHRDIGKDKVQPKSQKQHLFNQIRQDSLRLESVIKTEVVTNMIQDVKSEPMNIDEIERDAIMPIKIEHDISIPNMEVTDKPAGEDDLDWSTACDSFMEQLKSGCHKKKNRRRRTEPGLEIKMESETPTTSAEGLSLESNAIVTDKEVENSKTLPLLNITPDSNKTAPVQNSIPPVLVEQPIKPEGVKKLISPEHTETVLAEKPNEPTVITEPPVTIKQEPIDDYEFEPQALLPASNIKANFKRELKDKIRSKDKPLKNKTTPKVRASKKDKAVANKPKEENVTKEPLKTNIKKEPESSDDDEPLIKSKLLKEKEKSDQLKFQLLKDLSEKSAYVKLECCDVDVNTRKSLDSSTPIREKDIPNKSKLTRQSSRSKGKSLTTIENIKTEKTKTSSTTSDSDSDDVTVASRLRIRKVIKSENTKEETKSTHLKVKSPVKSSPSKKHENTSTCSTPVLRKPGFGDGSGFYPGWEEELYRYKRSLRMPTRLIAIPRGRSGGPFPRSSGGLFARGSTSLPDLDPAPLSPAPSSAPSAATDDLYTRRQDKITLDSDLESNSSYSAPNKLQYDSEASTSTVFSSKIKKKGSSIVDVLIQKCVRKDDGLKKKSKDKIKEDITPKPVQNKANTLDLISTPSSGLVKNGAKGILTAKKEKLMEDIFYLGNFRKDNVTALKDALNSNTDGLLEATEEFASLKLKTRTRTESKVLKQKATIKEVFGDDRPASAPPSSCREQEKAEAKPSSEEKVVEKIIKRDTDVKAKLKTKKILKDKTKRRSSSIRDGLRSTSLKRNDAKGRLLRLKKRNKLNNNLTNKKVKGFKHKKDKLSSPDSNDKVTAKEDGVLVPPSEETGKKRLKRLFCRRKFSSGFDYIRKKKKIIRREDGAVKKIRRPARKPSPESVHDIHKEIKGWFINKSIGETPLHRAARLGYTDCVAYCLEKLSADPSAKDNAGFTPLHVAAAKGHVRIGRLLLQYGANVSAAAQGGIRPLHEASENNNVEMIRLLLSYGADPVLGTYAGQTPGALAEGAAAALLRLHIADVQGSAAEPWLLPPVTQAIEYEELGCDPLASPPDASPPPPDGTMEIQCTEAPLPPFYSFRSTAGQPAELWCLLQDVASVLQIKSKESLLKQIHCGSGSPKELFREVRTQEFLERAQCHQLLAAGEKVNVRASKVALVRVTDKLRQLLKVETVLVS